METKICQSCAMPLINPNEIGTEKDGSPSSDYCCYCYKDGAFTADMTMGQMIDNCAEYLIEDNKNAEKKPTLDEIKALMRESFPKLKRWHNA